MDSTGASITDDDVADYVSRIGYTGPTDPTLDTLRAGCPATRTGYRSRTSIH